MKKKNISRADGMYAKAVAFRTNIPTGGISEVCRNNNKKDAYKPLSVSGIRECREIENADLLVDDGHAWYFSYLFWQAPDE